MHTKLLDVKKRIFQAALDLLIEVDDPETITVRQID